MLSVYPSISILALPSLEGYQVVTFFIRPLQLISPRAYRISSFDRGLPYQMPQIWIGYQSSSVIPGFVLLFYPQVCSHRCFTRIDWTITHFASKINDYSNRSHPSLEKESSISPLLTWRAAVCLLLRFILTSSSTGQMDCHMVHHRFPVFSSVELVPKYNSMFIAATLRTIARTLQPLILRS